MIRASMSPVSSCTSRAAARSPTAKPRSTPSRRAAKSAPAPGRGQATGRASAAPSASLPNRSMTVTSGTGDSAPTPRGALGASLPSCSISRSMSRNCGRSAGLTPNARAISRRPMAVGLSRMKAANSANEGSSEALLRDFTGKPARNIHQFGCAPIRVRGFLEGAAEPAFLAALVFFTGVLPLLAAFFGEPFVERALPALARGFLPLSRCAASSATASSSENVSAIGASRDRSDDAVMADIGAVATAIETDGAAFGVAAELAQQLWAAAPLRCGLGEQHDRAIEADRQHVVVGAERFVGRCRA